MSTQDPHHKIFFQIFLSFEFNYTSTIRQNVFLINTPSTKTVHIFNHTVLDAKTLLMKFHRLLLLFLFWIKNQRLVWQETWLSAVLSVWRQCAKEIEYVVILRRNNYLSGTLFWRLTKTAKQVALRTREERIENDQYRKIPENDGHVSTTTHTRRCDGISIYKVAPKDEPTDQ